MPGQDPGHRRVVFDEFVVDFDRGEVLRAGRSVRLRPKTLRVLAHFVQNAGRLVSREELLDAVWTRSIVTEDSLTQCVTEIRRALGDDGRLLLRTIARRGYIFDVRRAAPAPALTSVRPREPSAGAMIPAALAFLVFGFLGASQGPQPASKASATAVSPVATPSAADQEAAQLQRVGRYLFLRRGPGDLESAERHLERAVRLAPESVAAWTTLAAVYATVGMEDRGDRMYRLEERRAALEKALLLDPTHAEAHLRMGRLLEDLGQHEAAQRAFSKAVVHGANDPTVLSTRSGLALARGRVDEALALGGQAVELEPLSAVYRSNYGRLLLAVGEPGAAMEQFGLALLLSPQRPDMHAEMARSQWLLGRSEAARDTLRNVPAGAARDQLTVLLSSGADATSGESRLRADTAWMSSILLAEIAAHRDRPDEAFDFLHEAAQRWHADASMAGSPSPLVMELVTSPLLRSLQGDARWQELLGRLGARAA